MITFYVQMIYLKVTSRNDRLLEMFSLYVTLYEINKRNSSENSNAYHKLKKI